MAYLRRPLNSILIDICGTSDRAAFWCAFSNVTLFLLPILFMLDYSPEDHTSTLGLWVLAAVIKRGILGLAVTVVTLGFVVGSFIRRSQAGASAPGR
jgi:hypothetical protein